MTGRHRAEPPIENEPAWLRHVWQLVDRIVRFTRWRSRF